MIKELLFVTEEMKQQLRAPLPSEAVKQHPTKTFLSSIKSIYVTERLNDVFGIGVWQTRSEIIKINENSGMVLAKLTFTIPTYGIHHEVIAGNDNGGANKKGFDLGDACKGAITDCIGKIASWLDVGADVYKGKGGKKSDGSNKPNQANDDKPWLNAGSREWTGAVQHFLSDPKATLKSARTKYKINKQLGERLETMQKVGAEIRAGKNLFHDIRSRYNIDGKDIGIVEKYNDANYGIEKQQF